MAHMVHAKLHLVPVWRGTRRAHNARIGDEDVKTGFLSLNFGCCLFDRFERGQIEFQECDGCAVVVCAAGFGLDLIAGCFGLGWIAGREVDFRGRVCGELQDGLFAQAFVASRYQEDFVGQWRDVCAGSEGHYLFCMSRKDVVG